MSVAVRHARGLRAAAVIERFAVLWPRCFSVYERKRRPLKIGIDADVIAIVAPAIAKGLITNLDVKIALHRYCSSGGYMRVCAEPGTTRIDLAGKDVGVVTSAEAAHARQVLKLRKAARQANAGLAHTKNGPRTAGTASGPISTDVTYNDKSTPSSVGASPAV